MKSVVCLLLLLPIMAHASAQWPNEPAGAPVLFDCDFSHPTCNGRLLDPYGSAGNTLTAQSDATAPMSPSGVTRSTESFQSGNGGTELHYFLPAGNNEIFVGLVWRSSATFGTNNPGANKTQFIRGQAGGTNGVFYWQRPRGSSLSRLFFSTQLANNLDQCHGAPDQDQCFQNVNDIQLTPGVWYKIEVYLKRSTCPTCHNGILRWWINGTLAGNYLNFAYVGADEWVWSETWDGAGNGSGFTVNPEHYFDHLHISAPNCPSGCGGTGGEPVADTTPPGRASGLTITQLN